MRIAKAVPILRRIVVEAAPYWPHLIGVLILSLLSTPLALLSPLPLKIAIDNVLGAKELPHFLLVALPSEVATSPHTMLLVAAGLVIAIALLEQLRAFASWTLQVLSGEAVVLHFRAKLFAHVQRLSLTYHDLEGSAASVFRIQYDAPAVQYVMVNGIIPLGSSLFLLVAMIWVASELDPELALIALGVSPVLLLLTHSFSSWLREGWKEVKQLESSAHSVLHEALSSMRVVKAFGQEERESARFQNRALGRMQKLVRVSILQGFFDLATALTIAFGTALTLYVGVLHVEKGILTVGDLVLLLAYVAQLYGPLQAVSKKLTDLQASIVCAERAFTLLDEIPDIVERKDAIPLVRTKGHIKLERVSFAYPSGGHVLEDVSFEVLPNMRVGIQGPTGAGKSTLVSLLTRFYDVTSGRILLDGVDIRDYKLVDLRRQFAFVLQDAVLFSTTIRENIAYGLESASFEQVVTAAKQANAHDFITKLEDGYDTMVGERGMRLSGGERQRIALARAFLKDAPILVLDEPTSSLDIRTEGLVIEALNRLIEGRTTFMIAHRLTTLERCDLRLVVSKSRLSKWQPEQSK